MRFTPRHLSAGPLVAVAAWLATSTAAPAYDLHFDYTSFENSTGKHFQQAQFDVLNYPSINGNYMMTSTDNHRPEMVANGNALAEFYNKFCCATGPITWTTRARPPSKKPTRSTPTRSTTRPTTACGRTG